MKKFLIVFLFMVFVLILSMVFMSVCSDVKTYEIRKDFIRISEASGLTQFLKDNGITPKEKYLKKMRIFVDEYESKVGFGFRSTEHIPAYLKYQIDLVSDKRGNVRRFCVSTFQDVFRWYDSRNERLSDAELEKKNELGRIAHKIFELVFIEEGSDLVYKRNGWYSMWKSGVKFPPKDPKKPKETQKPKKSTH